MASAPIILVPGWWLGAWAWDEVAGLLREDGHDVTALTLPGLESADADRSRITFEDHVEAIVQAIRAAKAPVLLALHSGAGFPGYAATDRVPERIASVAYVDTAPGVGAMDAAFADVEKPFPGLDELASSENLDGLSPAQLATFRDRAVPEPGGVLREGAELTNDARLGIPSTIICTGAPAEQMREWAKGDYEWLAGLKELHHVRWVDLPTSHWVMWSRPVELAQMLGEMARGAGPGA